MEKQEGYCTYFATAFVLLARAEGLPARFVKGYCVPMLGKKEYLVTNDRAHAWAEVYFRGIGWVPFEPTPGYEAMRYSSWKEKGDTPMGAVTPSYPDFYRLWEDSTEPEQELPEEEPVIDNRPILLGVAVFLVLLLLILGVDLLISRFRYGRSSVEVQFKRQVERCLLIAAKLGIRRGYGETLSEFGGRLDACFEEKEEDAPVFWRLYEEVLYGEKRVTGEMVDVVRRERLRMIEELEGRDLLLERYHSLREL